MFAAVHAGDSGGNGRDDLARDAGFHNRSLRSSRFHRSGSRFFLRSRRAFFPAVYRCKNNALERNEQVEQHQNAEYEDEARCHNHADGRFGVPGCSICRNRKEL